MKIITLNTFLTIILFLCDRKNFFYSMAINNEIEKNSREIKSEVFLSPNEKDIKIFKNELPAVRVMFVDKFKNNTEHVGNYELPEKKIVYEDLDSIRISQIKNSTNFLGNQILGAQILNDNNIPILDNHINSTIQPKNILDNSQDDSIQSSLSTLRKLHENLEKKIKNFELNIEIPQDLKASNVGKETKPNREFNNIKINKLASSLPNTILKTKKKKTRREKEDDNSFMFYNSLSLIMLSMLAGGLVGVIFILYFSFKKDNHD